MSQEQYTSLQKPSEADPLLEQVFTPVMAGDKGYGVIMSDRLPLADFAVYARKLSRSTHYAVTKHHLVICLTLSFDVAVYAASGKRKKVSHE